MTQLEPYTQYHGMNLARRTLLGLLKYPSLISQVQSKSAPPSIKSPRHLKASDWRPAKGIYDCDKTFFDWVLAPLSSDDQQQFTSCKASIDRHYPHNKSSFKSLDCSIMELADDIAYGIHDLEDAIVLNMVTQQQWQSAARQLSQCGDLWFENNIERLSEKLFSNQHHLRKDAIGSIVNAYLPPAMHSALEIFKQFVSQYVIQVPDVQIFEYKGQQIIMDLFDAFSADPERLLPEATKLKWQHASLTSTDNPMRVLSDYIAAMTDGYAQKLHQQLF